MMLEGDNCQMFLLQMFETEVVKGNNFVESIKAIELYKIY